MFFALQVDYKRIVAVVSVILLCVMAMMAAVFAGTTYPNKWQQLSTEELNKKGRSFINNGQSDSALICFSIAAGRLGNARDNERKACISATFWLGHLYQVHYYNYQKAADCLLIAQQAATELGDSTLMAYIYHELGCLYLQYESSHEGDDMSLTLGNFKKAYWCKAQNDTVRDLFMFNLVTTGLQFGQVKQVLEETHDYCGQHHQPNYVTHLCHAAWCVEQQDYHSAIQSVDSSLVLIKDRSGEFYARLEIVERYLKCILLNKVHKPQEALDELEQYMQLCREYGLKEGYPDYYSMLSKFYLEQGNLVKANECKVKYYEAVDSLTGLTQLFYLTKAPLVFDLQKANEEVYVQKMKRERMTQIMWIVALAALIFLALMVMLYHRNKQLAESYRLLYEQNLEHLAHLEESRKMVQELLQPLPQTQEPEQETEQSGVEDKVAPNYDIDEQLLQDIYQRVKTVMENSPEIYDESFSMSKLNTMVGSNVRYISSAISRFANCDFKALLNQYRIQEACRRMNDVEHYGRYTIEAIAKSVGVTSRTSFIQNFKKQTGLTPSAYFKFARKKAEEN
jgi:AraC-like DNA-binding protein